MNLFNEQSYAHYKYIVGIILIHKKASFVINESKNKMKNCT